MTAATQTLRARYAALTGNRPDARWNEATLEARVAELEAKEAARAAAAAEAEAEQQRRRAEREARIAARGTWEQFCDRAFTRELEGDEGKLAYVCRRAASDAESAEKALAEFAAKLAQDPAYALGWSIKSFEQAAALAVAKEVRRAFEQGATFDELRSVAMREALRGARSPERSTSPTSNLMAQCMTAAWGDLVERMGDA